MKTYQGSCQCGKVRYEAELDLSQGTSKCNCTFCSKTRWWGAYIKPEQFKLISGEEHLKNFQFGGFIGHHVFCENCGVRSFERGELEELGGKYVSINLGCLDDVSPEELAAAPVNYLDGRNNTWAPIAGEVRHL